MFQTLVTALKSKEIRIKILITISLLFVYRIGCYIPIPGIAASSLKSLFSSNEFLGIIGTLSGGSLQNGTLFALGILPFINAFIIMQLLTIAIPKLEKLSKEGEEGRKKINQITRFVALVLAIVQAIGIVVTFSKQGAITGLFEFEKTAAAGTFPYVTGIFIMAIFVAGSMMVMWMSERITEYGIGNGASLIIFVGILSTAGIALGNAFGIVGTNAKVIWNILGFLILVLAIFIIIIFMDLAERKVTVQYSKQVKGNKIYGGQSTHIPIRVNAGGVMPIIFASSLIMFPQLIFQLVSGASAGAANAASWYANNMGSGTAPYYIFLTLFILFFSYFYSMIQFNPDDVAKNIQQYGGFLPGIRAGKPTSDYLRKINNRITLFGAIFLALLALIPTFAFDALSKANGFDLKFGGAFSATGLLIVVSVALELNKQLESQIMMRHYKGFLK